MIVLEIGSSKCKDRRQKQNKIYIKKPDQIKSNPYYRILNATTGYVYGGDIIIGDRPNTINRNAFGHENNVACDLIILIAFR